MCNSVKMRVITISATFFLVFSLASLVGCRSKVKAHGPKGAGASVSSSNPNKRKRGEIVKGRKKSIAEVEGLPEDRKGEIGKEVEKSIGEIEGLVRSFKRRPSAEFDDIKRELFGIRERGIARIDSMKEGRKDLRQACEDGKAKVVRKVDSALMKLDKILEQRRVFEVSIQGAVSRAADKLRLVEEEGIGADMIAKCKKVHDEGVAEIGQLLKSEKNDDDVIKDLAERGKNDLKERIIDILDRRAENEYAKILNELKGDSSELGPTGWPRIISKGQEVFDETQSGARSIFGEVDMAVEGRFEKTKLRFSTKLHQFGKKSEFIWELQFQAKLKMLDDLVHNKAGEKEKVTETANIYIGKIKELIGGENRSGWNDAIKKIEDERNRLTDPEGKNVHRTGLGRLLFSGGNLPQVPDSQKVNRPSNTGQT